MHFKMRFILLNLNISNILNFRRSLFLYITLGKIFPFLNMSGIGIDSSETVLIQDNPEPFTYKELLELITPSY